MQTRIISAFPGTGKSHFFKTHPDRCLDSDSSQFSWHLNGDGHKVRNPHFPGNYIEHIRENIGKYEFIFVSSHKETRQALLEECLFFYLIHPAPYEKEVYLQRYKDRGNDENFIKLVDKNWDAWISEIMRNRIPGCKRVMMMKDYLSEEIVDLGW